MYSAFKPILLNKSGTTLEALPLAPSTKIRKEDKSSVILLIKKR